MCEANNVATLPTVVVTPAESRAQNVGRGRRRIDRAPAGGIGDGTTAAPADGGDEALVGQSPARI